MLAIVSSLSERVSVCMGLRSNYSLTAAVFLHVTCSLSSTLFASCLNSFSATSRNTVVLTEESLTRPPEEVFDIVGKLGEG